MKSQVAGCWLGTWPSRGGSAHLYGRLGQEDCLRLGAQGQPGQHSKTHLKQINEQTRKGLTCYTSSGCWTM